MQEKGKENGDYYMIERFKGVERFMGFGGLGVQGLAV